MPVEHLGVVAQIAGYLWRERAWWLAPTLLALLLIGGLAAVSAASPLAPFLYPLF